MTSDELNALAEMELEMAFYLWERGYDELAEYCRLRADFLRSKANCAALAGDSHDQ